MVYNLHIFATLINAWMIGRPWKHGHNMPKQASPNGRVLNEIYVYIAKRNGREHQQQQQQKT